MKKTCILLAILVLSACANSETPAPIPETPPPAENTSSSENTTASETVTFVTSETTALSEEDMKYMIKGAYGETLDLREASAVTDIDGGYVAEFNGFSYAAKSAGIFYTETDDPEKFNFETDPMLPKFAWLKEEERVTHDYEYVRVNVGDKFGGLTVEQADYSVKVADGVTEIVKSEILYGGEITLIGYICAAAGDDTYIMRGETDFMPDSRGFGDLPVIMRNVLEDDSPLFNVGNAPLWADKRESIYTDVDSFYLGTLLDEEYKNADLSDIPYFIPAYAKVTLKNLNIRYYTENNLRNMNKAEIVSVKLI